MEQTTNGLLQILTPEYTAKLKNKQNMSDIC